MSQLGPPVGHHVYSLGEGKLFGVLGDGRILMQLIRIFQSDGPLHRRTDCYLTGLTLTNALKRFPGRVHATAVGG
jgi:hypothetical protein